MSKNKDKKEKLKEFEEVKIPMKFNLGTLKFEPQIDEINEEEIKWIKKKEKKSSKQEK